MKLREDIIYKIKERAPEFESKSHADIRALISRGHAIKNGDEKALDDKGIIRSHYHLSDSDKEAMNAANLYDIYTDNDLSDDDLSDDQLDEEE